MGIYYASNNKLLSSSTIMNTVNVASSAYLYVISGGVVSNMTCASAGYTYVWNGGNVNSAIVSSGGSVLVTSGGTLTNGTIYGSCIVGVGANVNSFTVTGNKGSASIYGNASEVTVAQSGILYVNNSGTLNNGVASNSGIVSMGSGGTVS